MEESVEEFGWRDFWIAIYTMCIVIPIPLIVKPLFTRKELNPEDTIKEIRKAKRKMK